MKMLTLLIVALINPIAFAGPSTAGGGWAVSCPVSPVEKSHIEMLDIYEGRQIDSMVIATASGSLETDYLASVERANLYQGHVADFEGAKEKARLDLIRFFRRAQFVDLALNLPLALDLGHHSAIEPNCRLIQVAHWDDESSAIIILRSAWDQMDSLNRAALVQHEVYYHFMRMLNDQNSGLARRTVAHMFAVEGVTPINTGLNNESYFYSSSDVSENGRLSEFSVTMAAWPAGLIRLQYSQFFGRPVLSRTWIELPLHMWSLRQKFIPGPPANMTCIAQDTGNDFDLEVPVRGTMFPDMTVHYTYKVGEPVILRLKSHGVEIAREYVSDCSGHRI